jgi:NAD(P)-dependent dehydrogenase (short-subunit alcohol dehydrogenase family)
MKTALITGGTRGIGLGIAESLAKEGWNLVVCGRRSAESVEPTLQHLRSFGIQVVYTICDIADAQHRADLVATANKAFGHINLLVNNAGIAPSERKNILEATEASYDTVMDTNLKGTYFLTQLVANEMIASQRQNAEFEGKIIFLTSISAETASPNRGEYCLSKAGLSMAAKLWAVCLSDYQIPVYEVRPGIIETDMTAGVKQKYDDLIEGGLLLQKRQGTPNDIGKAVAMLARGDMPYSTGAVLMIDGGFSASRL